jgi:hypothetical protein
VDGAWRGGEARPPGPHGAATLLALLAAGAFSLALVHSYGYLQVHGPGTGTFGLAALGLVCLVAAGVLVGLGHRLTSALAGGLVAWLAVAVALLASDEPWSIFVYYAPRDWMPATAKWLFLLGLAAVAVGAFREWRGVSTARFGVFVAALLLGAVWTVQQSPEPAIDVWHLSQDASAALLDGRNPYATDYAYAGNQIDFFPYPPVTLLLQLPAYGLLGDVRYAHVLALVVAAFCVRRMAQLGGLPPFAADAAGALLLVQGRTFYILEQAWTEPLVAALLALGALAWARGRKAGPILLALGFAAKQYLWLFLPLLWRLRGIRRADFIRAAAAVAIVFLPFFALGPAEMWNDVVVAHLSDEARSVTYPGMAPGDPWPRSNTIATHLRDQYDLGWPTWLGIAAWAAAGAAFAFAPRRGTATLLLAAGAALGLLGFLGTAFHPNYLWLLPVLILVGVMAEKAAEAGEEAAAAEPSPGPEMVAFS